MIAQSAEAAVESAEPTSTAQPGQGQEAASATSPNDQPAVFGTRLGELLQDMELPAEIRDAEIEADKKESDRAANAQRSTSNAQRPTTDAAEPAAAAGSEAAADDEPLSDEWPESARSQVMEERRKRKARTEELTTEREARTKAEQRAKELEDQLQGQPGQAQAAPTIPGQDPLARVFNFQQLNKVHQDSQLEKRDQEELLDFTARYPRGVESVLLGHDKDGNEIRRDYTEDQIAEMRVGAQQKLRAVDEVLKQGGTLQRRSAYLQERAQYDPLARKLYTDKERTTAGLPAIGASLVFDEKGQLTEDAKAIMALIPGITQHSDVLLNVGRYLRGLQLEQQELQQLAKKNGNGANGNGNVPEHLKAFTRPTPPIAPSAPGARTPGTPAGGRTSGDVDIAEQRVIESGGTDDQAIEDLIDASLTSGRRAQLERAPA